MVLHQVEGRGSTSKGDRMEHVIHLKDHFLRQTSVHLSQDLYDWLRSEANIQHVSLSKVVNDLLAAQRDLRRQLASSLEVNTNTDTGSTPIIHVLLERAKADIARSLDRQIAEVIAVRTQLQQALIMLDRAMYAYLLHTPVVPETQRTQALADAQRRYERWIEDVRALAPAGPGGQRHD